MVKCLTNQVLRVIGGPYFKACPPGHLNIHVPLLLVVRLLNSLVEAQLALNDQIVPDNPELLLPKVVRRPHDPKDLSRPKHSRLEVLTSHRTLAEASTAVS